MSRETLYQYLRTDQ
ncbi:hypothetical protein MKR46_11840 [Staphylococcus haemolyticus]|uniref:Uncharacterized protein n=1 Tax=Escherichia coli TaxID=562 RepID=A0AAI8H5G9_ECOLX|nr:hypothetical protein [Staphylococcus haemolyticus]MCH4444609.1 hypothetical protein [Staphylococcus haemolyticus]MCH4458806.1 hypothetical protein [Staphylococcus haemolyticus]